MALILPETSKAAGANIAEALRQAVARKPLVSGKLPVPATVSVGVATLEPNSRMTDPSHLLKAADLAVYAAKLRRPKLRQNLHAQCCRLMQEPADEAIWIFPVG